MDKAKVFVAVAAALCAASNALAAPYNDWTPRPAMQKWALKQEVERREHATVSDVELIAPGASKGSF